MKRLSLFCICLILCVNSFAQINLFDRVGGDIVPNPAVPKLEEASTDFVFPLVLCKEYSLQPQNKTRTYTMELYADSIMPEYQTFLSVNIKCDGKQILKCSATDLMRNVEYLTKGASTDYYIQLPLDDDSFAIFLGGWMFGYAEAPEMMVIVVRDGVAKVVFDNYVFAYKYTQGDNFAIEYIDHVDWLADCTEDSSTPTPPAKVLNKLTKYKIWKEGNMLKYKSWK